MCLFCFFKQKTAYELRISDWSSDVCSSDLGDGIAKNAASELQRPARAFEITFVLHFTHGGENVRRSDFRDRHAANRNGELRKQVLASRRGGSCPCLLTVTAPLTAIFFGDCAEGIVRFDS